MASGASRRSTHHQSPDVELPDLNDVASSPSSSSLSNRDAHDTGQSLTDVSHLVDGRHPFRSPQTASTRNLAPPSSPISQIWHALMSRSPLLMRSSPALGTSSYGAVPLQVSSSPDDVDDDDGLGASAAAAKRAQARRKKVRGMSSSGEVVVDDEGEEDDDHDDVAANLLRKRTTSSSEHRSRRSITGTDLSLGPDCKASFAVPGEIAGGDATSSGASILSDENLEGDGDYVSDDSVDNSPYPEVRASVPATDNITLSINTPRMWILSMMFAIAGSATNLFFSLRYPSVAITPVIALVLVHPLGRLWDYLLKREGDPPTEYVEGARQVQVNRDRTTFRTRLRWWLAQGSWNEKEHACVYISSNVSFGFAFATDIIVEQHKFYKQDVSVLYQLLLTISTQILGYAFAGLTRRYLVRPAAMIWPGTLMSTAMFTTMHKQENKIANGWTISRYRFFVLVWAAAFAWYFLPGLLMPALSYFNVITWFAPDNVIVANLFGVSSGLGLFPVTFDWAQIAYIGSPLLTPWWAAANVVGGLAIVMWIVAPILYYRNSFFSAHLPIVSTAVFDNTGKPYDVSKILTPEFLFDEGSYERYSRVYLPITYALSYAVQFAALSALISHTTCWHGGDIVRQSKEAYHDRDEKASKSGYRPVNQPGTNGRARQPSLKPGEDIHSRLMRRYDDVPMTWYLVTFVAMLSIGIVVVEYYPTHLPWYGLFFAIGITTVFFIPVGIVMAITNQHSSLYLVCQMICGVVFPGRPVANMVFVTYSYISSAQGIKFSSDMKLGHYMKIPPKLLFKVQMFATLISSVVQIGVLNWMFLYIPGLCTPEAINGFNCPIARVHFNGSILWGVVGPQRFFGPGALYRPLVWAFLIGAVAPVLVWLVGRNKRRSFWRKVNLPVLFGSLSWIPPATGLNFSIWAVVCFAFNHVIRRRASAWWGKYTMTMSAALDSGLAFALVVVFFGFIYPGWMDNFKWWGTEIYKQGCDWKACPYLTLGPGETFGP